MRFLKEFTHKDVKSKEGRVYERRAARGIVIKKSKILLMFTKAYNDYSFPGGGIAKDENLIEGLKREMAEETGAQNIRILSEFGYVDEYRPHRYDDYDIMHMLSYHYVCEIDDTLQEAKLEDYEIANGMSAVWIDIHEAIQHNLNVIQNKETSMGMSIERETYVLKRIADELL